MGDEEEVLEYTLLNKRDAKVYKIPPAAGASGHKAGDWAEAVWRGNVRIIGKGKDLTIKLLHNDTGNLFAQCVIPNGDHEKFVEKVIDSSRYWVLKIMNGSRHAFIGFGFSERNDAFDFSCCLQDFKSTFVDRDKEVAQVAEPLKDLSLKEGEKITVKIPGAAGARRRPPSTADGGGGGGPIGILAPPPPGSGGGLGVGIAPPPAPGAAVGGAAGGAAAAPAAPAAAPADDFADFDSFADFQSA